jgi:hypothetical protein
MKKNNLLFSISVLAVITFTSNIKSAEFFTGAGSSWLGGSFAYANISAKGMSSSLNYFVLNPIVRFFAADCFFLGPRINWVRMSSGESSQNMFGFGAELGFAFGKNLSAIPYLRSGIQLDLYSITEETYSYNPYGPSGTTTSTNSQNGYTIPLGFGLMIPFASSGIGLQFELGYDIKTVKDQSVNVLMISFGFCGIGKTSAVSFMQALPTF